MSFINHSGIRVPIRGAQKKENLYPNRKKRDVITVIVIELRAHGEAVAPRVLARRERERERGGPIKPMAYSREGRSVSPRNSGSPGRGRRSRSLSRSRRSRSRSNDSGDASNPGNNLYVTGLSTRVTSSDLEKYFSSEGKVLECHLVTDPRTRESRGFAFVTMETVEDANRCVKYLNRSVLEGRVITVEKLFLPKMLPDKFCEQAKRKRGRTPTPGRYQGLRDKRATFFCLKMFTSSISYFNSMLYDTKKGTRGSKGTNLIYRDELSKKISPKKLKKDGNRLANKEEDARKNFEKRGCASSTVQEKDVIRVKVRMTKQEAARLMAKCKEGGFLNSKMSHMNLSNFLLIVLVLLCPLMVDMVVCFIASLKKSSLNFELHVPVSLMESKATKGRTSDCCYHTRINSLTVDPQ
ncbi:hypothetical protein NC653_010008 [Populus alba x Populus x berolinensis]|uniref:RRM domain-containing protein n=1 Tax=Populus alba x Populus x berolinensis TaxID=444605 RepID=A0AAD6WAE4_9ROSI|nr:hypothetical protein NC653_010008 [Populus alba x Populus x berolinensis]